MLHVPESLRVGLGIAASICVGVDGRAAEVGGNAVVLGSAYVDILWALVVRGNALGKAASPFQIREVERMTAAVTFLHGSSVAHHGRDKCLQ